MSLLESDVPPVAAIGEFPEVPDEPLQEAIADSLQSVLDEAVSDRTVGPGITAGLIVGGSGSWSGATGVDLASEPLTPESQLEIASIGKTVTAAQVMRLVDEGTLGLLDPITDHLPPEAVSAFDANGATIQDLLGMRSGLREPPGYEGLVDSGSTPIELLERLPAPINGPGSMISYVNMNYVLLGMIIERETGLPFWNALESGILDAPHLAGIAYPVTDALAADGWMTSSDSLTLARWGYELYGGFVVSEESLRAMTDFKGGWYGLGTIDFQADTPAAGVVFDLPAVGHGGLGSAIATALVVFPEQGSVVALQAPGASLKQVYTIVGQLRDVAHP
jgi:D-alanyl-D-alanine carboxypeptidase